MMGDSARLVSDEHGITDAEQARIVAYLRKPAHSRTGDDLGEDAEESSSISNPIIFPK